MSFLGMMKISYNLRLFELLIEINNIDPKTWFAYTFKWWIGSKWIQILTHGSTSLITRLFSSKTSIQLQVTGVASKICCTSTSKWTFYCYMIETTRILPTYCRQLKKSPEIYFLFYRKNFPSSLTHWPPLRQLCVPSVHSSTSSSHASPLHPVLQLQM